VKSFEGHAGADGRVMGWDWETGLMKLGRFKQSVRWEGAEEETIISTEL